MPLYPAIFMLPSNQHVCSTHYHHTAALRVYDCLLPPNGFAAPSNHLPESIGSTEMFEITEITG